MPKRNPKPKPYAKYPPNVRRMLMRRDAEIEQLKEDVAVVDAWIRRAKEAERSRDLHASSLEASESIRTRLAAELASVKAERDRLAAELAKQKRDTAMITHPAETLPDGCCGESGPATYNATVTIDPSVAHLFKARPTPPEVQAADSDPAPVVVSVRESADVWTESFLRENHWDYLPVCPQYRYAIEQGGEPTGTAIITDNTPPEVKVPPFGAGMPPATWRAA